MASQPTLSRFENARNGRELFRLTEALADCVIERHRRRLHGRARRITIDLDPADDATHGGQQLSFFHGRYDSWCYLPVLGFLSFDEEAEQYLGTAVLRPGNAPAARGAVGILRRLLGRLRRAFPRAAIRERLLKRGARVGVSVRRIVLHLPWSYPYRDSFRRLALSLGALSG